MGGSVLVGKKLFLIWGKFMNGKRQHYSIIDQGFCISDSREEIPFPSLKTYFQ
jgi:hypothetical protein